MKIAILHQESAFANAQFENLAARLRDHELVAWSPGEPPPANDFTILLGAGRVDRALLETQPHLELLQTTSAGYEGVDLDAATSLGIWVSFAPSGETGNAVSVAEWAVALMLAASRDLGLPLDAIRERVAFALSGKAVCIVGLGGIGHALADRLRPSGVRLIVVDEHPKHAPEDADKYAPGDLKVAVASADYVVLCVPATAENENLFDASILAAMKRDAFLINVARGTLVDEPALRDALESGHLHAAGLDVVRNEPVAPNDPLVREPHAFVTPHIAGPTDLMIEGTSRYIGSVVDAFVHGQRWDSLLNDPPHPRRPFAHE
ncbi:MAG: NAD(P)-dependent oxidoreductase [Vulcanimicrobiaceae bacterium]